MTKSNVAAVTADLNHNVASIIRCKDFQKIGNDIVVLEGIHASAIQEK
jgi:hypothetical protein